MIQRHSVILWKTAYALDEKFERFSEDAYKTLDRLQNYPLELHPNYLVGMSRHNICKFEWNINNFRDELKKGVNKEGNILFEDLGYTLSFFSSIDEEKSCGIKIIAGNKNKKFFNSLILDLPLSFNVYDEKTALMVCDLFKELVNSYNPFWGCVSNPVISRQYGKFYDKNLPTTVHWINYWSDNIIHAMGEKRLKKVIESNPSVVMENGVLIVKDTAFDVEDNKDIEYHNMLQNKFFK